MEIIQSMIKERRAKAIEREILKKAVMILDVFGGAVTPAGRNPEELRSKEHKDDSILILCKWLKTGELCDCLIEFCGRPVFLQIADEVASYHEGAWDRLLDLVAARAELTKQLKRVSEDEDQLRQDLVHMKDDLGRWGI